jgi:hypothetical protein
MDAIRRHHALCFFDIGDGKTQLVGGARTKKPHDLDVARQIFATIQFP